MGTTINIAKGAKAGEVCLAEVSMAPGWLSFLGPFFPGPCFP